MLGGCGMLLAAFGAVFFWNRHDKSKKAWGDAPGCVSLFLTAWIIASILLILLALVAETVL